MGDLLKMRVIHNSKSAYFFPVVIVKKKDDSNRICIDYRNLNEISVFDAEPMDKPDFLIQKMSVTFLTPTWARGISTCQLPQKIPTRENRIRQGSRDGD